MDAVVSVNPENRPVRKPIVGGEFFWFGWTVGGRE